MSMRKISGLAQSTLVNDVADVIHVFRLTGRQQPEQIHKQAVAQRLSF